MSSSIWLYPGQGAQNLAMLEPVEARYFEMVAEITGRDYRVTLPDYNHTIDIQLALLMTQMSGTKALKSAGLQPDFVAGHSLGAFSAAACTGVLSEEDAIALVYKRSSLMESLYPTGYGMGVIVGLTRREVERLVESCFTADAPIYVSNQNEELQLTISGAWVGIDRVIQEAKENGASMAKRLSVPTPSHSILMQPVADELTLLAKEMHFNAPKYPYFSNCTGRLLTEKAEIVTDLIQNVVHPVQWLDMMQVAIENRMKHFIELPPGSTLTNLVKRSYPSALTYCVDQYGIEDTIFLFNKRSKEV